jgi:hypothetical protein
MLLFGLVQSITMLVKAVLMVLVISAENAYDSVHALELVIATV